MSEPGSFDLASLFFNWNFDVDTVTVNGSSGADEITFDNVPAEILAGAGDDTLIYQQTTAVWSGHYDGGTGTDTLQFETTGNFGSSAEGGAGDFNSIERIEFVNTFGTTSATFDAAQFGAGKISLTSTIIGDAGTQEPHRQSGPRRVGGPVRSHFLKLDLRHRPDQHQRLDQRRDDRRHQPG